MHSGVSQQQQQERWRPRVNRWRKARDRGKTEASLGVSLMNRETLLEIAQHQAWADAAHWKTIRENTTLLEDAEIRTRLNHMMGAMKMLTTLARGETPDTSAMKAIGSAD